MCGATGVQGIVLYKEAATYDAHDEHENFGDNYFLIFNGSLVRDPQDEAGEYLLRAHHFIGILLY